MAEPNPPPPAWSRTSDGAHRRLPDELLRDALFLVGPTASGKSSVAMRLAKQIGGEIIALDSRTLYRGFDIGTAKPTAADRAAVPHHLIDVTTMEREFNVADYIDAAVEAAVGIAARGRVPMFVGGAGMYLRAILRGMFDGPPSDAANRAAIEERADRIGRPALHRELAGVDPISAGRIHPNDRQRVVRALEVLQTTGRRLSDWQSQPAHRDGVAAIWLDRPRANLHERINARARAMIDEGWLDEVETLLQQRPSSPSVFGKILGYPELAAVVRDESSIEDAIEAIQIATRQFAKRQVTWFRNLGEVDAIAVEPNEPTATIVERVRAALGV